MKLEAVGRISMSNMGLKIRGQIDNVDGSEWAFLRADTASNAEGFRDECNLGFRSDFNAQATTSNDRTGFLALLSTFLKQSLSAIHPTKATYAKTYLRLALNIHSTVSH